ERPETARRGRGPGDMSRRERERAHRQKRLQRRREDEERRVESEYVEVSSEEEHELCFREPQQLVDSFTELEEKNLFLIHSSQETEQQLDELRHLYENSKREMGAKVQHLKDTVKAQEARIAQEQQRFEDLRRRHDEKADTRAQDRRVGDLKAGVRQLYARCCPHSADHDRGPLQMLAEIEAEVEKLITGLQEYSELGPGGADLITELEKGEGAARSPPGGVHEGEGGQGPREATEGVPGTLPGASLQKGRQAGHVPLAASED
ncbi:unnamed protein product, partial [Prorocentrum cordatum]